MGCSIEVLHGTVHLWWCGCERLVKRGEQGK
jgi:hypothetical protein